MATAATSEEDVGGVHEAAARPSSGRSRPSSGRPTNTPQEAPEDDLRIRWLRDKAVLGLQATGDAFDEFLSRVDTYRTESPATHSAPVFFFFFAC